MEERQVLYCISVPALNDWVFQGDAVEEKQRTASAVCVTPSKKGKRSMEMDCSMDVDVSLETNPCTSSQESSTPEPKRLSTEVKKISNQALHSTSTLNLNFPIEGAPGMACLIKLYDCDDHPSLKLNDVVDVIGFLSVDPLLGVIEPGEAMDAENQAKNPPASAVPRVHAIYVRKLVHSNLLPADLSPVFTGAENVRKELHLVLSQILLGDALAADYLICHLISIVYMRKDSMALGHLSLNLSNMPQRPDYTRLLYSILQRLVPKSHYFPMTLNNMNTMSLIPKMDYEANRLTSGLLQLSDHTHLVVDETRMEAGKLDATGVHNVQALGSLISQQSVNYDFQFYTKPYDADIPVLVLSEGKSLLPSDVHVPLHLDPACLNTVPEIFQAAGHFLKQPLLSAVRIYLETMRHASHEFPEDLQKRAQEDFVEMRRVNGQKVSPDDLHLLLVLAKLISLSYGERVVTQKAWEQAKLLEQERKARIESLQAHRVKQPAANEP